MNFKCLKDTKHKFTLEKPPEIEGAWSWRGKVHCPYCGTEDLEEDMASIAYGTTGDDKEAKRRANREATMHAKRMAAEARREYDAADPEVRLKNLTGEGASREAQMGPMTVRTSVLKRLADKAKDAGYED